VPYIRFFSLTLPAMNGRDDWLGDNPEKSVLFLEQMMYQSTDAVALNNDCTNGIHTILLYPIFPNFVRKMMQHFITK